MKAYRTGDVSRAKQLVYQHHDWVKSLARTLIMEAGGEV